MNWPGVNPTRRWCRSIGIRCHHVIRTWFVAITKNWGKTRSTKTKGRARGPRAPPGFSRPMSIAALIFSGWQWLWVALAVAVGALVLLFWNYSSAQGGGLRWVCLGLKWLGI